ncbi:hypothetical protein COCMIDRAFT_87645, partial [Bipolaris oryzae ATCC 44560]
YRKCATHPLGDDNSIYSDISFAPTDGSLVFRHETVRGASEIFAFKEQTCHYESSLGCTRTYC